MEQFPTLSAQLQQFVQNTVQGQAALQQVVEAKTKEIVGSIEDDGKHTRQHLDNTIADTQMGQQKAAAKERLLQSLRFDEINLRRNTIDASYPRTFEWIFEDSAESNWSSISKWLSGP